MDGICLKIGAHLGANRHLEPVLALAYYYLKRTASRLERLIARWQAGTLIPRHPAARASRAPAPAPSLAETGPRTPKLRLPSGKFWLIRLVQPTAQLYPQLEQLVASPEMAELLAAAPQAGRILRPLFRMYGLPMPEILHLPPVPRRPRPPRSAKLAPAVTPVTAQERRKWRNYSPGRLPDWLGARDPPRRKFSPA